MRLSFRMKTVLLNSLQTPALPVTRAIRLCELTTGKLTFFSKLGIYTTYSMKLLQDLMLACAWGRVGTFHPSREQCLLSINRFLCPPSQVTFQTPTFLLTAAHLLQGSWPRQEWVRDPILANRMKENLCGMEGDSFWNQEFIS